MIISLPLLLRKSLASFSNIQLSKVAMSQKAIVAVCQMKATENKQNNLEVCKSLIVSAKKFNAQASLLLPLGCNIIPDIAYI